MNPYTCKYIFIFILIYKYDDGNNNMQNSICTFIIIIESMLNYLNKYNYSYLIIHIRIGVII